VSIPVFVFYELLIRLSELNPNVGDYFSHTLLEKEVILQTTTGLVKVPRNLLKKQFTDPRLIAESELSALISHFKKS
jgi:hypothetical protein